MQSILVTGGAGFIGSCFVRQWIAGGHGPLVNLDKLTYAGNLDSLAEVEGNPAYHFVEGNITDDALVERLLETHRIRWVIHFAAESHVDRSIDGPEAFVQTNVVGTFRLLETTRRYWSRLPRQDQERFRFLHISTDEVYGSLGPVGMFSETTPYAPNSPYSASKAASDHFARAYYRTYGLPVLVTHCSNNYGPFQFPEKLIPLAILNALEGKPIPVFGDGEQVRDWLYVEDHCRALALVLAKGLPGEVYNIGGNAQRTNLEVVREIAKSIDQLRPNLPHAPCEALITHVTDRPGHDRRYAMDDRKIRQATGWKPHEDFSSGLRRTVQWYLDNPNWIERVCSGTYRRERLGLNAVHLHNAAKTL